MSGMCATRSGEWLVVGGDGLVSVYSLTTFQCLYLMKTPFSERPLAVSPWLFVTWKFDHHQTGVWRLTSSGDAPPPNAALSVSAPSLHSTWGSFAYSHNVNHRAGVIGPSASPSSFSTALYVRSASSQPRVKRWHVLQAPCDLLTVPLARASGQLLAVAHIDSACFVTLHQLSPGVCALTLWHVSLPKDAAANVKLAAQPVFSTRLTTTHPASLQLFVANV